ncbi:MAG: hypothetical protein QM652_07335 [Legionella sp.]|uniref:hypothetical protein n=1 Tax=Legionella sp. TaxID=459 RepID=UPI0039E45E0C
MPYLVKGNAQQVFLAFGQSITPDNSISSVPDGDLSRILFIGDEEQANVYYQEWQKPSVTPYYKQGNLNAEILSLLLGPFPLQKEDEDYDEYDVQYANICLAYVDENNQPCAVMLIFRRDDLNQWMLSFTRNAHLEPQKREVMLLSSFDFKNFLVPRSKLHVKSVAFTHNTLKQNLHSPVITALLSNLLTETEGVKVHAERIKVLARKLQIKEGQVTLPEPIDFSKIDYPSLFVENPALDLLIKHNCSSFLSLNGIADLLTESSVLADEIDKILPSEDQRLYRNLLRMTVAYFENNTLKENRNLLADREFLSQFSDLADKEQVHVVAFLYRNHQQYPKEVIHLILLEPRYFKAVNCLVQMGFAQDVCELLTVRHKQDELEYIDSISNEDAKRLCLVFWIKGKLTIEGYKKIVAETKKYPFMASTLVALDKENLVERWIDGLAELALSPQKHLPESIKYHFDVSDKLKHRSESELMTALKALDTLKCSDMQKYFHLVLAQEDAGNALRLFLPQIAEIKDTACRQALIEIFAVNCNIASMERAIARINNLQWRALANDLKQRYMCGHYLRVLGFNDEMVTWTVQEKSLRTARFRKIIMKVEEQYNLITDIVSEKTSYRQIQSSWEDKKADYRRELYNIVYKILSSPNTFEKASLAKVKKDIEAHKQNILKEINPPSDSILHAVLVGLANIVISILTLFIANIYNLRETGDFLFFNKNTPATKVCILANQVITELELEFKEDSPHNCIV